MYFKDLQTTLQNLKKDEKITLQKIANALGISSSAVSQGINSKDRVVQPHEIKKLENYFMINLQNPDEVYNYNRSFQHSASKMETIGNRLQTVRKTLGLYVTDVAKELKTKPRTLGAYERNENYPPADFLSNFMNKYNVNPNYLLEGYEPMFKESDNTEAFKAPVENNKDDIIELERIYIKPECGKGSELDSDPYIEPFRISRQTIQDYLRCSSPDNLKLFQAAGDSMEDRISDGDWLLVDIGRKDASISGIYVFKANERYRCKRLNMTLDGRLEVKSDNKKYDKEIVGPESQITIEIIGRVLNNLSKGII